MRNVLFLAYDFPPISSAAAQRARGLARHLPAHGWQPVVVSPRAGVSWARDPATAEELPATLEVRRTASLEASRLLRRPGVTAGVKGGERQRSSLLSRRLREWVLIPDSHVGWIPFALAAALRRSQGVDVVLSTSPPASAHIAGGLVARLARKPWVADFQDPWSLPSFCAWGGRWRPWVDGQLERKVLRGADAVVATTEWLGDELARRGGERVTVVPNGCDPAELPETSPARDVFTLVHAGSFYGPRSPEPLLAAVAAALEAEPSMRGSVRVRLLGSEDARNEALLGAATRRLGLEDVVERAGQVPRGESLAAIRGATALALVTDAREAGEGLIPLKLYEYLAAGRPVLALTPADGEAGRLLRATDAGLVVDPSDTMGARDALRRLYTRWRAGVSDGRSNGKLVEAHAWNALAGRLAQVLAAAAAKGGHP